MRWALPLLVLAAGGCVPDHGNYPGGSGPPPGGGGTITGADAAVAAPDAGAAGQVAGTVCVTADPRAGSACTTLTGSTLTVRIAGGGAGVAVAADGSFDLPVPAGSPTTITVRTNTDDVTYFGGARQVVVGAAAVTIPLLRRDTVQTLVLDNPGVLLSGTGILVVRATVSGSPAAGAELGAIGVVYPYYDAGRPDLFSPAAPLGPTGTGLYFGVVGAVSFSIKPAGGAATTTSVQVPGDTVTFVDVAR